MSERARRDLVGAMHGASASGRRVTSGWRDEPRRFDLPRGMGILMSEERAGRPSDRGRADASARTDRSAVIPLAGGSTRRADAIEVLSHELRSPITSINLGAKVLKDAHPRVKGATRDAIVDALESEVERLSRLIEDLLAVARHEGGEARLPVQPLLLQRVLPAILATEVERHPELAIRAHLPADLPTVLADDAALAQILRDLIANAARFGGAHAPVEVVAQALTDEVELRVLDRGPGIDPDEAERLFEPFYRSPRTTRHVTTGAGLGLTAARRLLGAMGGRISARAREGGGAEIVIRLALAPLDA